jgi:polysaccharide pyruvyl transferase WcaK-like protein
LLGYGGANNTGADARIATIVNDVRHCLGEQAMISVGTVNPEKTRRYISEGPTLRIERIPFVFPIAVLRLVARHDLLLLVEGSTFKQNWSSALLYAFLWSAFCAHALGKRCIAYAVDAGKLDALNAKLTRSVCNSMDLLIMRTAFAAKRLRDIGVDRPIHVNTDTAFTFASDEAPPFPVSEPDTQWLGFAPVEFHQWPVRVRAWGPKDECYHWPYYFSWSDERRDASRSLVDTWTELVSYAVSDLGTRPILIAMEQLDEVICEQIAAACEARGMPRPAIVSAGTTPPRRMVPLLRRLDGLVTSRYHACVLSMGGGVPQMAIAHDERLSDIYEELTLHERLLLRHDDPALLARAKVMLRDLWDNRAVIAGIWKRCIARISCPNASPIAGSWRNS